MQNWRGEVTELVVDVIRRTNYRRDPESLEDWQEICRRLDLSLSVMRKAMFTGCLMDDVITVKPAHNLRGTCARIAHEVAEYLLTTEVEAPYLYRPEVGVSADAERHQVARMVEMHAL